MDYVYLIIFKTKPVKNFKRFKILNIIAFKKLQTNHETMQIAIHCSTLAQFFSYSK